MWAYGLTRFVLRAILRKQNDAQTARFVEQAIPELRNNLINSVLLSQDTEQQQAGLVQLAIREAADDTRKVNFKKSISTRPVRRWSLAALISCAILVGFAILQTGPLTRGLLAVMAPGAYVPNRGTVELLELSPGDTTIFAGQSVTLSARVRNDRGQTLKGEVIFDDGRKSQAMLAGGAYSVFTLPLGRVDQTFRYAVRIGDTRWPRDKPFYTVNIIQAVDVEDIRIGLKHPAYTGLKDEELVRNVSDASFDAPLGTLATVTLRLSASIPAVMIERPGAAAEQMHPSLGNKNFTSTFSVDAHGGYRIVLRDSEGRNLQQFPQGDQSKAGASNPDQNGYYNIRAIADPAPKIRFLAPGRDIAAGPGRKVRLKIRAFDKYGLESVKLLIGLDKSTPKEITLRPTAGDIYEFDYTIDKKLADDKGLTIVYYATATDRRNLPNRLGPQTTRSGKFKILVQDVAKVAAERAKRFEELRRRLMAMLAKQTSQRVNTGLCLQRHRRLLVLIAAGDKIVKVRNIRGELHKTGGEIHRVQQRLKADILDLLEKFPFDQSMISTQQVLAVLAGNEVQVAIDQSQVFAAVISLKHERDADIVGRRNKAGSLLAGTQDKIIDTLQMLLAIMPSLMNDQQAKKSKPPGGDLPAEAQEKIRKLKSKLEQFIEEEKKAVEASKRLVKKPVDTFTTEDEKVLKDLAAVQDKWEKFINESLADFSRLAQQDFSNPVVMKELLSVKADITMAKDALKKKATEIATAMEDNGVENAESLTANLEKWLPDEPDRKKWAMEAPEEQENFEMPELPTELEDLVGDLLEQEEDIFDEMDDVTSKAMGSFDKGAGWDALDGPISSMNAQGVTGNQMPNSSEISGRSGEGRTGKSTGEFVEDKAVGKGGRRTPTRLTPEPFQKGQIDDKSTDPPGGATGGGKLSGSGAEGLEGPVPPALAKEMKRLAGKQASLINRAER
ncbi:MAG: hypothetical protein K8S14_05815, partial [Actinomycetia bacterium]|nr:hypothetical protein [Actinomycetes bacterium]